MKPTAGGAEPVPQSREDAVKVTASELQKELKRVGCFAGDVTGEWDAASRRAMRTFLDRVNAKLPVQQPDHILLTLVRGYPAEACGSTCPAAQVADATGACIPRTVVAKAPPREPSRISTVEAPTGSSRQVVTASVPPAPATVERTGAPPKPVQRTPDKVAQASSWTTEIAPSASDAKPVPRIVAEKRALPGRMTLGGAAPAPVEVAPVVPGPAGRLVVPARPGPKQAKVAAAPSETPSATAGDDDPAPGATRRVPGQPDESAIATRPAPETRPSAVERPAPTPTPRRAPSQNASAPRSYTAPAIRSAPRRDWKAAVFDQTYR